MTEPSWREGPWPPWGNSSTSICHSDFCTFFSRVRGWNSHLFWILMSRWSFITEQLKNAASHHSPPCLHSYISLHVFSTGTSCPSYSCKLKLYLHYQGSFRVLLCTLVWCTSMKAPSTVLFKHFWRTSDGLNFDVPFTCCTIDGQLLEKRSWFNFLR